ncbi:hypothetical protein RJ640_029739 [Escallonia rubra]|uniref:Integrase catalytic domain-containing protein n=1 Tax=Escallonia rubra TaxID=112253 RepID=A0AA88UGT4_9ASTE|nr:hypothetical protein RJ640_029739 [Escallonia rubra]
MSGLECQPSMRHPSCFSTLYPSPLAKRTSNMLACLNALEPRWTDPNQVESSRAEPSIKPGSRAAQPGPPLRTPPTNQDVKCLSAISEASWLWHRKLGHVHMEHLKDISSKELVKGLPKIKFEKNKVCDACQMGKQKKVSHKPKKMVSTSRPLQLLHMDLFGPIPTTSLGGKSYCFVIVDDYSRYT